MTTQKTKNDLQRVKNKFKLGIFIRELKENVSSSRKKRHNDEFLFI